jgi:hypothetical protein
MTRLFLSTLLGMLLLAALVATLIGGAQADSPPPDERSVTTIFVPQVGRFCMVDSAIVRSPETGTMITARRATC